MKELLTLEEAAAWLQSHSKGNITQNHIADRVFQGSLHVFFKYVGELYFVSIQYPDDSIWDGYLKKLDDGTTKRIRINLKMDGIVKSLAIPPTTSNIEIDQIISSRLLALHAQSDALDFSSTSRDLEIFEKNLETYEKNNGPIPDKDRRFNKVKKVILQTQLNTQILNLQSQGKSESLPIDVEIHKLYSSKITYADDKVATDRNLPTNKEGHIQLGGKITGKTNYIVVPMDAWLFNITDLEAIASCDKPPQKKTTINRKTPPEFASALNKLLDEIVARAKENGTSIDTQKLPGKKVQLLEVAKKYDAAMDVAERTFSDYIAGHCAFKAGRQTSCSANTYAELFPEIFQQN